MNQATILEIDKATIHQSPPLLEEEVFYLVSRNSLILIVGESNPEPLLLLLLAKTSPGTANDNATTQAINAFAFDFFFMRVSLLSQLGL